MRYWLGSDELIVRLNDGVMKDKNEENLCIIKPPLNFAQQVVHGTHFCIVCTAHKKHPSFQCRVCGIPVCSVHTTEVTHIWEKHILHSVEKHILHSGEKLSKILQRPLCQSISGMKNLLNWCWRPAKTSFLSVSKLIKWMWWVVKYKRENEGSRGCQNVVHPWTLIQKDSEGHWKTFSSVSYTPKNLFKCLKDPKNFEDEFSLSVHASLSQMLCLSATLSLSKVLSQMSLKD